MSARRLKPTLCDFAAIGSEALGESAAMRLRANTRGEAVAAGAPASTSEFSEAVAVSQAISGRELGSSPPRWLSTICARRTLFSARSV
ncbi:hypothetical protein D9M68_949690 [compost metagenome]